MNNNRTGQSNMNMSKRKEGVPHHVVVGGGTSAIICTYQLLRAGHAVTLIERGEAANCRQSNPNMLQQLLQYIFDIGTLENIWTVQCKDPKHTDQIESDPQCNGKDRKITYAFERGLGGNSNINAMIHDIGSDSVYDNYWPKSWNSMTMRRLEKVVDELIPTTVVHCDGNMKTLMQSASESPQNSQIFTSYVTTIDKDDDQRRWYLERLLFDSEYLVTGQLNIVANQIAQTVEFIGETAVSVISTDPNGKILTSTAKNGGEIVLCCGVFETPRLLLRSGLDLPGIGRTLLDHPILPYLVLGNWKHGWNMNSCDSRSLFKPPVNGVHGWIFLDKNGAVLPTTSSEIPTCQLLFVDGTIAPGTCDLLLPNYSKNWLYRRLIRPVLLTILQVCNDV
jgi:hypothetical protein